ncbi:MAG: nitronate monooxygenase [Candidatus Eremiobacteraeota bacterium]|nr:nitronate monooxygenase [Candidatus Eremiobacteraeota bacterium]MCW5871027.1 nitronate monooxygenase [Candidatus Eremiobacteraeota bacterium]
MAGVSTPAMAAAVSQAGGLGGIAIGHLDLVQARAVIETVRKLTDRPFNVNLFCHQTPSPQPAVEAAWLESLRPHFVRYATFPPKFLEPAYPTPGQEVLQLLLEMKPAVVSLHFGLPEGFVAPLRAAGIYVVASATNLHEALLCQQAGVEAIVAQGMEAGGHRGCFDPAAEDEQLSTLVLVQLLKNRIDLPLIAAGGIMHAAGVRAALQAGASACQLGTAYIACPESSAEPAHIQSLLQHPPPTVMTRAISGRPARCLANLFTAIEGQPPDYPIAYSAGKALHAAARAAGEFGYGAHWAGQGAPLARSLPAAELTQELCR